MTATKTLIFSITIFFLASCGGGGGGGGGSSNSISYSNPNWISSLTTSQADVYRTSEYDAQWGLETINAAKSYALLNENSKTVAGSGVKIGIVDSGVQTSHAEISSNYSSSGSYNYVSGNSTMVDDNGHGTNVASIAAGVADDSGMHGVAYDSTIIAEKVLNASGSGTDVNVASGITNAVNNGANIINLSLGGTSTSTNIYNALITAKNSDVLVVAATGNDGNSQPDYPARYASNSNLLGYVLAVGAIGYDGTLASYSNYCGDAQNYCLVAPGGSNDGNSAHGIYAALPVGSTIDLNSAYGCDHSGYCALNGTSMATPMVAGAAAVIEGAWPFLTAPQVAKILLTSANRSFSGYDATKYGQGILDLYAAVQAQGQNTLGYGTSVVSSAGYDVRSSSLTSDPIFGDAFSANVAPQLAAAIFYDDYGRDYKANLGEKISQRPNNISTAFNSMAFNNYKTQTLPLNFGGKNSSQLNLQMRSYADQAAPNQFGLKYAITDHSHEDKSLMAGSGFSFTQNFANNFSTNSFSGLTAGFAFNRDALSNIREDKFANFGFVSVNNFAANPFQSFVTNSTNSMLYSTTQRNFNQIFAGTKFFNQKFAVNFSQQTSYDSTSFAAVSSVQNRISDVNLAYSPNDLTKVALSVGNMNEFNNNLLNSKAVGAFGAAGNAKTSYFKLSFSRKLFGNISLISSYSEGRTAVQGNSLGIFRNYSDIRSRSSSLGLVNEQIFGGKMGLIYSEPMRVYSGSASINVPVARDYDGNITRYSASVSLKPQGKEQDVEMFYAKNLTLRYLIEPLIKFNLVAQKQPGNIKSAGNAYLGMVTLNGRF